MNCKKLDISIAYSTFNEDDRIKVLYLLRMHGLLIDYVRIVDRPDTIPS